MAPLLSRISDKYGMSLSASSSGPRWVAAPDSYSSNIQLAMPFADLNGTGDFLEDYSHIIRGSGTSRTIGTSGTAPTSTASPSPKWSDYGESLQTGYNGFAYASNGSDSYLQWMSTTQWTGEGWAYASSGSYGYNLLTSSNDAGLYYWGMDVTADNAFYFGAYPTPPAGMSSSTGVFPRNQWFHWAVARNSQALACWVNGTRVAYNASSSWGVSGNMGYVNLCPRETSPDIVLKQDYRIYNTLKYNPSSSTITVPGQMFVLG